MKSFIRRVIIRRDSRYLLIKNSFLGRDSAGAANSEPDAPAHRKRNATKGKQKQKVSKQAILFPKRLNLKQQTEYFSLRRTSADNFILKEFYIICIIITISTQGKYEKFK